MSWREAESGEVFVLMMFVVDGWRGRHSEYESVVARREAVHSAGVLAGILGERVVGVLGLGSGGGVFVTLGYHDRCCFLMFN
jgi:hypothetical protein